MPVLFPVPVFFPAAAGFGTLLRGFVRSTLCLRFRPGSALRPLEILRPLRLRALRPIELRRGGAIDFRARRG